MPLQGSQAGDRVEAPTEARFAWYANLEYDLHHKSSERTQSFIRYFTDVDLVDVEFTRVGKRLVAFRVNDRAHILGEWREVVRYDNAHGQALHIHRFWPPTAGSKEYLETQVHRDYTDALDEALSDLDAKWQAYRELVTEHATHDG